VTFDNNRKKLYDSSQLLQEEIFRPLSNDSLFNWIKVDAGGYDQLDLSEAEIWINRVP
jgi:hypothetical protein